MTYKVRRQKLAERWLLPEFVFAGQELRAETALRLVDEVVEGLYPANDAAKSAERISGVVSPGFIDLQVNGGGGVLFNSTPTSFGIQKIVAAHRQYGTTGILPTVITDTKDVLAQAVEAILDAQNIVGILGIHIEGPHISKARRGTHSEHLVRPMDNDTISHVKRLKDAGIAVMITVAPEATTSDQISALSDLGAIVSIGHSDATADETRGAIQAGVTCATHLFNAMSPMLNRTPGVTGAVINSEIAAGIIVDGIHVANEMVALAMRARPTKDRMFLVSDAMPTVGGPDQFDLYGRDVRLSDGRLVNSEGSLAGAHVTLAESVFRLVNEIGIDKAETLRAAISVPARLIGREDCAKVIGAQSHDLIRMETDLKFTGFLVT